MNPKNSKPFKIINSWKHYLNEGQLSEVLQLYNLNWFCNIIMGGEDYHKNHHENPSQLVMGKYDTTGRFLVPWLLQ